MIDRLIHALVETVFALGYPGLTLLMAIESSFIPFPSELVLPPAGYLAAQGRLDPFLAGTAGLLGSLLGALFNYWFALRIGDPLLRRYGRYVLIKERDLDRAEAFFRRHGEIGTFIGRLVPVIRQLISVPAGLARMHLGRFVLFTGLGAGIWCAVLIYIGWLLGRHEATLREAAVAAYASKATLILVPLLALLAMGYIMWYRRRAGPISAGAGKPD